MGCTTVLFKVRTPAPAQAPRSARLLESVMRYLIRLVGVNPTAKQTLCSVPKLLPTLVKLLAQCVRAKTPPFPRGTRRVELAVCVLQLMFNLGDTFTGPAMADPGDLDMTQCVRSCARLLFRRVVDARVVSCQARYFAQ